MFRDDDDPIRAIYKGIRWDSATFEYPEDDPVWRAALFARRDSGHHVGTERVSCKSARQLCAEWRERDQPLTLQVVYQRKAPA